MSPSAVARVCAQLDLREKEAKQLFAFSKSAPSEPDELRKARQGLARALKDSTKLFYDKGAAKDEAERQLFLLGEKPTGFKSWITGRTARWKRRTTPHQAVVDDYARRRATIDRRRETHGNRIKSLEATFRPMLDSERKRREQAGAEARAEFKLIDAARACLKENPDLAREGLYAVVEAARRRLERGDGGADPANVPVIYRRGAWPGVSRRHPNSGRGSPTATPKHRCTGV